jgi:hypothetical protein
MTPLTTCCEELFGSVVEDCGGGADLCRQATTSQCVDAVVAALLPDSPSCYHQRPRCRATAGVSDICGRE